MTKQNVMTVASLKRLLNEFGNEITDDFQIWLSYNPRLCLAIEPEEKRIILFPSHR